MRKRPGMILLFLAAVVAIAIFMELPYIPNQYDRLADLRAEYSQEHIPSTDHAKLPALQRKFETPQDVTEACISCHTERHIEVMESSHWNWAREEYIEGRGITYAGKQNLINNFCIGIGTNEQSCTKCHIGYGYNDSSFDFTDGRNVDCLVCHDQSGQYVKASGAAGYPAPDVDLGESARSVGPPQDTNCGACHFFSGGGNNVKHGDLEVGLLEADQQVDVHMGYDGVDMDCIACHETERHQMKGQLYSVSSMNKDRATCESCHGGLPHTDDLLNEHTIKVSCQTCHIPTYAKVNATKMTWDWSKAGKLKDGQPYHEEDEDGNHTYLSIKGEFTWAKNVEPDYVWFNGTADHYFIGDKVDTSQVIKMNTLNGEYRDKDAKIIPVKIHRAKQIYDCQQQMIIQPKLYAEKPGEGGYWQDFAWDIAAKLGMEDVGQEYSGHFCFVETEMYWPVNHMVAPAEDALTCNECHDRENSRLAGLDDFYMPGRDAHASVEFIGKALIIMSLLGVVSHLVARIVAARTRARRSEQ